jgi:hypothetical protein
MSINVRIQAKTESILEGEAEFYRVGATALVKAILDKVTTGGTIRHLLQGVDVTSYQDRKPARPKSKREASHRRPKSAKYYFEGKSITLYALGLKVGVPCSTIRYRMRQGLTLTDAIAAEKYAGLKQPRRKRQ